MDNEKMENKKGRANLFQQERGQNYITTTTGSQNTLIEHPSL